MRRLLAAAALAFLAMSAGCSVFGGADIDQEDLSAEADYDWNTTANVTITVEKGADRYEAVYRIEGRESLELYRFQELGNERSLPVSAVRFRYPNGTVVTATEGWIETSRSRTTIRPPAEEGLLALSAPKRGKHVSVAAVLPPPYEMVLPPGARVRYPLLARVVPRDYERSIEDGRVRLRWEEVRGDRVVVRYYLVTDLLLFGGLVVGGAIAAVGGVVYFLVQLRTLKRRREEVAWDGES